MKKLYFSCMFLMAFGFAQAQIVVSISQLESICNVGDNVLLSATHATAANPANYTVEQSPNYNPFPYSGGTLLIAPPAAHNGDDFWSPALTLPFRFRFYGRTYEEIQIGSNGLFTFDAPYASGAFCDWIGSSSETLPNMNLYPNSIYGVYQDLDFSNRGIGSINYYVLDTGIYAAPNRVFVCNFNQIPSWADPGAGRQTSQIVLHEFSNIIEVNVERRVPGNQWDGAGLIGIQNIDATKFLTPTGRNTGSWSAQNEGWIFKPYWENIPVTLTWTSNGQTVGTGDLLSAWIQQPETTFTVTASYTDSDGFTHTNSDSHTVVVEPLNVSEPVDLYLCENQQTIDLTVNDAVVTDDAGNYNIRYYTDRASAQNGTPSNRITTPANYTPLSAEQTIYMRIMEIIGAGCFAVKQFQVSVGSDAIPSGAQTQYFTTGQTLNDLVVTGGTITWYNAATGGNLLPGTTLLQNGVTYYAENSSATACQTKQTLAERLPVTVFTTLSTTTFNTSKLVAYPNPVSDIFKIVSPEVLNQVDIYNAVGQLVLAKTANSKEANINVSALVNGVYFARISSEGNNATIKFIKN